jgi:hypothetical protein
MSSQASTPYRQYSVRSATSGSFEIKMNSYSLTMLYKHLLSWVHEPLPDTHMSSLVSKLQLNGVYSRCMAIKSNAIVSAGCEWPSYLMQSCLQPVHGRQIECNHVCSLCMTIVSDPVLFLLSLNPLLSQRQELVQKKRRQPLRLQCSTEPVQL